MQWIAQGVVSFELWKIDQNGDRGSQLQVKPLKDDWNDEKLKAMM